MKKLLILFLLIGFNGLSQQFDGKKTYVLITGVLKWQDSKSLASFSNVNRKDLELKNQFIAMGVPAENITTLIDEKATLKAMQDAFVAIGKKCTKDHTFIFYYAGHGIKRQKDFYFCNYDIDAAQCKKTGFGLSYLSTDLLANNKAGTIMLWADCCYSGGLLQHGEAIKAAGRNSIVFSSATSSNISTGNWTFTQTLLDCFRCEELTGCEYSGIVSTGSLNRELSEAMKYREHQKNGYYSSFGNNYIFINKKSIKEMPRGVISSEDYSNGEYAYGFYDGKWKPVRVKRINEGYNYSGKFYFYSDYKEVPLDNSSLKKAYFTKHSVNDKVNVIWEGKEYPATILKAESDFYYIKYDGYDETWNEWIMYNRIKTGKEKKAKIEEHGQWYPGEVMEEKDGKYFIRYDGYDFSWDEWVGSERIKF